MNWYKKLLYWGLCSNYWGWFHALAGGLLARGFLLFLAPLLSVLAVFVSAVIWEAIEFFWECNGKWETVEFIYKSKERWFYDSVGDIVLAVACAFLVSVGV